MTKTLTEQQIRKTIENGTGKAAKVCEQKFYDKPKSLTEQWREGTLKEGFYYILFASRFGEDYITIDMFISDEKDFMYSCCEDVKEVLAPVPNYEEFVQQRDFVKDHMKVLIENMNLKRKLEIATKALKEYADRTNWIDGSFMCVYDGKSFADEESAEQALKEMEGVK